MDQTTTLITFMLQTSPKTQSVHLVGSWDNFQTRYLMDKDDRRGRGQWRCCYAFKDIICDGDGARSPKRDGGLKMGHTYWYYYELDDGVETYDTSLPSTTACPFLPGQPVNVLSVPTEVTPLRERSGSVGASVMEIKTMNPADKYLTPRAVPPAPYSRHLPRLNTSPAMLNTKRPARSASPSGRRSPWSARSYFGLKSPTTAAPVTGDRGRMTSPCRDGEGDSIIRFPSQLRSSSETMPVESLTCRVPSRDTSPVSVRRTMSRNPSPLRHRMIPENTTSSLNSLSLIIPDEITEEEELDDEDDNFASNHPRPDPEKLHLTSLSPPPSRLRACSPLAGLRLAITDMKPLPMLPNEGSTLLMPPPLRLVAPDLAHEGNLPRSHFSVDTISTGLISLSPTESNFSSTPSICDSSNVEDDHIADESFDFGFAQSTSSKVDDSHSSGFRGYSLPTGVYDFEQTIRKESMPPFEAASTISMVAEPRAVFTPQLQGEGSSALDEFLAEMGYLGGIIEGK